MDFDIEQAKSVLNGLTFMGKAKAIEKIQETMLPIIMDVFSKHGAEELEMYILTDYSLVENETPPGIKNLLYNLGQNPEMRQQWEGVILEHITPENIKEWLRNPEEWLDEGEADEQREELKKCAEVLEETPGGQDWLERQVWTLYRMAQIVPEDSTPMEADD